MTKTILGQVAIVPMGEYSAEKQYHRLNSITYNGSSYLVLKEVIGVEPVADNVNYQLIAAKGEKGLDGAAGAEGQKGADGQPGADGASATINGVNTLTIVQGKNVNLAQEGDQLTVNVEGIKNYQGGMDAYLEPDESGENVTINTIYGGADATETPLFIRPSWTAEQSILREDGNYALSIGQEGWYNSIPQMGPVCNIYIWFNDGHGPAIYHSQYKGGCFPLDGQTSEGPTQKTLGTLRINGQGNMGPMGVTNTIIYSREDGSYITGIKIDVPNTTPIQPRFIPVDNNSIINQRGSLAVNPEWLAEQGGGQGGQSYVEGQDIRFIQNEPGQPIQVETIYGGYDNNRVFYFNNMIGQEATQFGPEVDTCTLPGQEHGPAEWWNDLSEGPHQYGIMLWTSNGGGPKMFHASYSNGQFNLDGVRAQDGTTFTTLRINGAGNGEANGTSNSIFITHTPGVHITGLRVDMKDFREIENKFIRIDYWSIAEDQDGRFCVGEDWINNKIDEKINALGKAEEVKY